VGYGQTFIQKLVPDPVSFDMASGSLRFFGPTTDMHMIPSTASSAIASDRSERHWPIAVLAPELSVDSHDYLMGLYWRCHNDVMHLVDRSAFYRDLENGESELYSSFLHMSMLATAYRYADQNRKDIQKLKIGASQTSSTLHERVKTMAQQELENPGGIPSIQALTLLGAIEVSSGRNDTGWVYSGEPSCIE